MPRPNHKVISVPVKTETHGDIIVIADAEARTMAAWTRLVIEREVQLERMRRPELFKGRKPAAKPAA
jgi:hypothetical protein